LNRYTYVRNNPTSLIDPLGLFYGPCYAMPWLCGDSDSGGGGAGGTGGPPAPLLDTGGEAGGGGGGGTGGKKGGKPYVDLKVLDKCVQQLFGVAFRLFAPSEPGQSGVFVGYGPDSITNAGNNAAIGVGNDNRTYSEAWLTAKAKETEVVRGRVTGLTNTASPYVNWTANDVDPNEMLTTQIHELGHSLGAITTGNLEEKPYFDNGKALEECVKNGGGFRSR
jgi:hypothetical protein